MFGRNFWLLLILVAAIGGPYAISQWSKLKASWTGEPAANSSASSVKPLISSTPSPSASNPAAVSPIVANPAAAVEMPMVDMAEVFRLNVSPTWVMSRWPRVSSGLPEESLQGLRVALVTGTRQDDLAGSLTYYFTPTQRCSKITFSGTTGDPSRITSLAVDRFGFKPFTKGEPGVTRYEIRWNGKATSELLIHPAAVIRASSPYARYEVQMVITDPAVR